MSRDLSTGSRDGGYDDGYRACPCFWGDQPGSLVRELAERIDLRGSAVLDVGAGEGKNAYFLAARGARVDALELSHAAIANGLQTFGRSAGVNWQQEDVRSLELHKHYDVVVAYGLFHCMNDRSDVAHVVRSLQAMTKPGGYHVVCAFNARSQDLSAHPGFRPCLLDHNEYLRFYDGWSIDATDSDLHETHPHNEIPHIHSMTRLTAMKMQ